MESYNVSELRFRDSSIVNKAEHVIVTSTFGTFKKCCMVLCLLIIFWVYHLRNKLAMNQLSNVFYVQDFW